MLPFDFFTAPSTRLQVLYVFLALAHERLRIIHFGRTAHPTAERTAHQLREAFPWETASGYLLRNCDLIFGYEFVEQVKAMGIEQVLSAPRSPWQRAHVERLIGSIRRESLDHFIVLGEGSLRRSLASYVSYYPSRRTHLSLGRDAAQFRRTQTCAECKLVEIPESRWSSSSLRAPGCLKVVGY